MLLVFGLTLLLLLGGRSVTKAISKDLDRNYRQWLANHGGKP